MSRTSVPWENMPAVTRQAQRRKDGRAGRHRGRGSPASPSALRRISTDQDTGLKPTNPRPELRSASRAYRGTRNLRAVQVLLGHESIATTERYTAVDDSEMRAAMEAAAFSGSAS